MITITVCVGSSCHLKGSHKIIKEFENHIKAYEMENIVELKAGFCLGKCADAVTVKIGDDAYTSVKLGNAEEVINKIKEGSFD